MSDTRPSEAPTSLIRLVHDVADATRVILVKRELPGDGWTMLLDALDGARVELIPPGSVAITALQHVESTGKPLLVANAPHDQRLAADPFFSGMACCSLMAIPVVGRHAMPVVLLVENSEKAGAFGPGHLETVTSIATRWADAWRNDAGGKAGAAESRDTALAQFATNVLHNVGNVLTSVSVSAHVLTSELRKSPASQVGDVARLLDQQHGRFDEFFAPGGKGALVPAYLRDLAAALDAERERLLKEVERLSESVDHMKNIVAIQQSYAGSARVLEPVHLSDVVDDALRLQEASMSRHGVVVSRDYGPMTVAAIDKTRVIQIVVNLLENARQAMDNVGAGRRIDLRIRHDEAHVVLTVQDQGCGIPPENLEKVFTHGFTTKSGGHGFGLHSCAVAATQMGGSLRAFSEGTGKGATFVLRLPAPPL